MNTRSRYPRSERGQAVVLIVFVIIGLIGITALAVDGGMALANRRQAQNAADSAALAASLARIRGDDFRAAAFQNAARNGYSDQGDQNDVQVNNPPVSGPYLGNGEYIQVVITSHSRTFFGPVIGIHEITNTVQAVVRAKPPEWGQILNGYAVISLAPTSDCMSTRAFWVYGEATLDLKGGGVWVNSNNRACAFIQQGNGSVAIEDTSPFTIVGGASIQKPQLIKRQVPGLGWMQRDEGGSIPFQPTVGAVPVPYPPPFVMPKPTCGKQIAEINKDGTVMTPGNWEEDFPPKESTTLTLESGIYCINGDVNVNGHQTLIGTGVVLYVENGSVHINGGATVQIQAPGNGPFQGLLMFLPMENDNIVVLNGNADSVFQGTILAPASLIRITGNDSSYGFHSQIIGFYIELTGDSNLVVKYVDSQNYDAVISPEIQFGQ